ncbi:MAG: F0F1 ATP synthase subunit A [Prevotella sp.]|nr:F0F1 ATP synthase subunit A [Prevotella sp.]
MKYVKLIVCMMMLSFMGMPAMAASEEGGKLNTSEIVVEHIKDSYAWHVTTVGDKAIVIDLPVIVRSSTGWHIFSTARFAEESDVKGYRMGPDNLAIATQGDNAGKIVELQNGVEVRPFDISITKTVAVMMINVVVLLCCILIPARWYRRHKASDPAPGGFTGFIELIIDYVEENIIKPGIGNGYEKYSPYLLTCFFFILTNNLMGIIPFPPGGGNVTGNITITFFLALCTFIVTQVSGTKHYWKDIFWPEVPLPLKVFPLIPLIEFVSIFTKPFALMIRLFANMMAGHAIALSLTCIIFVVAAIGGATFLGMSAISVVMSIFMMCLELLVCFIQAMVFTMLSSIFIGLARAKAE